MDSAVTLSWPTAPDAADALRDSQAAIARMIVDGVAVPEVLKHLCRLFESAGGGLRCDIQLVDGHQRRLNAAISSSTLAATGPQCSLDDVGFGSAVAAAVRHELVIAEDVATDPLWTQSREIVMSQGFRSTWSIPVLAAGREVLAVFTGYRGRTGRPTLEDLQRSEVVVAHACIALAHDRTQKLLRETVTRLELAQDIAKLGYWEHDLIAKRTAVTGEINRLVGLDSDYLRGLNEILDRAVPEDRPIILAAYQEVATNSPELTPFEFRINHPHGGVRHLLAQRRAFRSESGRIIKVIGTLQDVTAQRLAASRLQESEERFRMVAEHTGQLILDCRLDAGEVHCAGAVREILGSVATAAGALKLDIWRKLVHPDDVPAVENAIRRVLHGERVSVLCRIQRFDGEVLDVEVTGSALLDERRWATRIIATVSNISDRRRAEAERQRYLTQQAFLADAARKVNSVLSVGELLTVITNIAHDLVGSHVAVGILLSDEGWREGLLSAAASEKYAALGAHRIGETLRVAAGDLLTGGGAPQPQRRLRAAMTDDEQTDVADILRGSGILSMPLVTSAGVKGVIQVADKRDGDFSLNDERILGQLADLAAVGIENARLYAELETRVRHRTQQLEQSNRELEAFSYSVSHDLRGPLRAISGFTGLLAARHGEQFDAESRHYLERIQAGTLRMSGLIDDLLELSRVTQVQLRREPVDLSAIALALTSRLQEREPHRSAEIVIDGGLMVDGDSRLLEIALDNLFDNAWKFTAGRPLTRIRFGVRRSGEAQVLFVQDNGVGFDPRYASNLFGVFQRLHSSSDFPGTGVGLATVQRIVQRHGGRIWAEAGVDSGATFYFTIAGE